MVLIVKLVSIAIIVYGCLIILRPDTLKKVIEKAKEGNLIYIASGVKGVIGLLFLIAAASCSVPWIIRFFGALSIFGAIVAFVIKRSVIVSIMDWVEKQPARFNYYYGILALLMGVLMALAA